MRKIITLIVIGIAAFIAASAIIGHFVKESKKQTGLEWYYKQDKYLEDLASFQDSLDDIVTLYVCGAMGKDDFLTSLETKKRELIVIENIRNAELAEHPLKTASHTYESQTACEAVDDSFSILKDIINMLSEKADAPDDLRYQYIAFQQKIIEVMSRYEVAKNIIYLENGETENTAGETKQTSTDNSENTENKKEVSVNLD